MTNAEAPEPTSSTSPFHTTRATYTLPLPPLALHTPIPSLLQSHFTPLLLHILPPPFPPSHLLLAYHTPALVSPAVLSRSGGAHAFVDLALTLVTYKPAEGAAVEGWVNIAGSGHIGVVVMGVLNAVVKEDGMGEGGWKWDGEKGGWVRKEKVIAVGSKVRFTVKKWGGAGSVIILEGSMKGGKVLKGEE